VLFLADGGTVGVPPSGAFRADLPMPEAPPWPIRVVREEKGTAAKN
jgi:hypothetical protein